MSEGFDREAERERLRQQLEEEEEDRKATQQMSELLLKGATMTNRHCDQCGDPIFRYQGQAFCPTCQRTVAAGADSRGEAETTDPEEVGQPAEADEPTTGSADEPEQPGATPQAASAERSAEPARPSGGPAAAGDLGEARAALVRKLSTLAAQAEATEDVGRSRELLAAAKEAAEAIEALENAWR